jgi:non-specific serine/threonine protein kinase/serine/threonine-protein kinase
MNAMSEKARSNDSEHPQRIGPYRLLQVLGEGGMGQIFEAEQTEPVRRRVALKLIKLGMDTRQVVARFEAERQALAVMEHPNIAKVLDAGATEMGRPYFVMELVRGIPLTDYCDTHKLSTRERLELFLRVCHAIQHAHQKGVIHRDLKPSNVLVMEQDGQPTPKVIDFGIAKAISQQLTERTLVTQFGQAIGTPAYMSPEQADASGLDVDTRTDIYSLGIMLYELLVGRLPIDPAEVGVPVFIARLVARETDPLTPSARFGSLAEQAKTIARLRHSDTSALRRELKGDLDWIVMKAMEKDRSRRYETANGLAMDIQRYLNSEPVVARPPSASYRIGKFVKRHRVPVAAAALLLVSLIAGMGVTAAALMRATRAERRAAQEAEAANQVADFLVGLFKVSNPSEALGNTITAREILDKGAERIATELDDQPVVQARMMETMGLVYLDLGLYDTSRRLLEEAVTLREAEFGSDSPELATSLGRLAELNREEGNYARAESLYMRTLAIHERHADEIGDSALAVTLSGVGALYWSQARYDEAEPVLQRARRLYEDVLGPDHPSVANILSSLAVVHWARGEYAEAEPLLERSLEIRERTLGPDHPETAGTLNNLGALHWTLKQYDEAERFYLRAKEIYERTMGPDHPLTAAAYNNLGETYWALGRYGESNAYFMRALSIKQQVLAADHPSLAITLNGLANLRRDEGNASEAEALYKRALGIRERVFGPESGQVVETLTDYATLLRAQSRDDEAARLEERVAAIRGG